MIKILCNEELVEVSKLVPHPDNDKIHSRSKIKKLAENIAEFGFDQPIVANVDDNTISKGNGRHQAAIHLKMTHVPVLFKKYESKEAQLAELKADNEIPLFEMAFDKAKTKRIIENIPERLKQIAMPDYSKMADIMRFDNHIINQDRVVPQTSTMKSQNSSPLMSSADDVRDLKSGESFDEDYSFNKKDEAVNSGTPSNIQDRPNFKNLIIRLEGSILEDVKRQLVDYFEKNNIPATFL